MFNQPINAVEWIDAKELRANDYNPNHIPPPELKLLKTSIMSDGWTQPIVVRENNEIVDGFHRLTLASTDKDISKMTEGKVPVVRLNNKKREEQMMATVRHNRARGAHGVMLMADIVRQMKDELHMADVEIMETLGMEEEEVERLYDNSGMTERGAKEDFNTGWTPKDDD